MLKTLLLLNLAVFFTPLAIIYGLKLVWKIAMLLVKTITFFNTRVYRVLK